MYADGDCDVRIYVADACVARVTCVCTCVFLLASLLRAMCCVGVAFVLAAGEQLMRSISAL